VYTSRIIKGGALLGDTSIMLASWDLEITPEENLDRFRRSNVLGKSSRMRLTDVLTVMRRRYVDQADVLSVLVSLEQGGMPAQDLTPILYFQSARSDRLLFDCVAEFLRPRNYGASREISRAEVRSWLLEQVDAGRTQTPWSPATADRIAQGLLSALRDFGILQGAKTKHIAAPRLPVSSFAIIARLILKQSGTPKKILDAPAWQLFFLNPGSVERLFFEAQQDGLLRYQAAGSVVRIDFPVAGLEEYARAIAAGSHRFAGRRLESVAT
jgi:hypothetical protein